MAFIEMELTTTLCQGLASVLLSRSPIPMPTLALFGSSRLLSRPFEWGDPVLDVAPRGFVPRPGTLPLQASVTITHVSLEELTADAAAPGVRAACMAWLLLSAEPGGGLRIELLRLETGRHAQVFDVPLLIERQPLPLAGVGDVRGGAVLLDAVAGVVTIRYATGADDLFRPRRNLLNTSAFRNVAADWLIRIPGEFFAELVHRGLNDALTPPPRGVTTEEEATTVWAHPVNDNWGVVGHVGIEQRDACADVDLSVDIGVTLNIFSRVDPGRIPNSVDLELRLWSDTSDWDTFRCWAATSLAGGPVALAAIAEYIRVEVGTTVKESEIGNGFTEVDSDSTSVTYQRTLPLPVFPAGNPLGMEVGPDGLVVHGHALLPGLTRVVTFDPAGSVLPSLWEGKFSCGSGWRQQYNVAPVVVRDQGRLGTVVAADIPVRIFPTTKFEPVPEFLAQPPADEWSYSTPFFTSPSAVITPRRTGEPRLREAVMFFLHTSAGLRRFDIGPIGRRTKPSRDELKIQEKMCRILLRDTPQLEELKWVVEPPRYNYGSNPLRQWMLTFRGLPRHANVVLHARGGREDVSHHYQFREGAYSGVLELVTDADIELVLEHDLGDSEAEIRINQRWLLPTRTVPLPGPAEGISLARMGKRGERVLAVHVNGRSLALGSDKLTEWTGLPFARAARQQKSLSVSLRNGQVAAIVGCSLIIAVPLDVKEPERQVGKRYAPSTYSESRLSTK